MIKRIVMKGRDGAHTRFTKYVAENGKAICTVNGQIIDPNAGNDIYRRLKADGAVCLHRKVTEVGNDDIIDMLEDGIDRYVEYIDNYRQYEEAVRNNERLYRLISAFKRAAEL